MNHYYDDYVVKRKLFGYKLVDRDNKELNFVGANVTVKVNSRGIMFFKNREPITPYLKGVEVLSEDVVEGITEDGTRYMVNLKTGRATRGYKHMFSNFVCGDDGVLYFLSADLKMMQTQFLAEFDTLKSSKMFGSLRLTPFNGIIVKNIYGKFGVINAITGANMVPFVFDNPNIKLTQIKFIDKNNNMMVLYEAVCKGRALVLDDKGNILLDTTPEQLPKRYNNNLFIAFDKSKNRSVAYRYSPVSNKLIRFGTYTNEVMEHVVYKGKHYIITKDSNKKLGLVDKNNNVLIENKHDNIALRLVDKKPFIEVKHKDSAGNTVGLYDPENGKFVLPPIYREIHYTVSAEAQAGLYKFFVKDKSGHWGVVNSKNKIELPFMYTYASSFAKDAKYIDKLDCLVKEVTIKDLDGHEYKLDIHAKKLILPFINEKATTKQHAHDLKVQKSPQHKHMLKDTQRRIEAGQLLDGEVKGIELNGKQISAHQLNQLMKSKGGRGRHMH